MHQSKAPVELSRILLFLKMFVVFSAPENPKNRVKIRLFIGRLENHVFDLKSLKNDRF